jgi:hypothetical protein
VQHRAVSESSLCARTSLQQMFKEKEALTKSDEGSCFRDCLTALALRSCDCFERHGSRAWGFGLFVLISGNLVMLCDCFLGATLRRDQSRPLARLVLTTHPNVFLSFSSERIVVARDC